MSESLERLADGVANCASRPGLAQWQPPLSGEIDIRIDRDGDWYHEGTRIERQALVQLFASILRREADGHYYLVTPVEKWRIRVDDAALLVVDVDRVQRSGEAAIECLLNVGARTVIDAGHPLRVMHESGGEPRPYVQLDHGLTARVLRAPFYRLVEWGAEEAGEWVVHSAGARFSLGPSA